MEEEYIKLIFGLKLKQIRTDKNLSLFGLSKLTGLSKSYLNEIEKGKKYPKTDKIVLLAEALDVPYDQMVSLKLDKNLAPIGEILQSKILKEIPLNLFGIQESDLIDIIAEAPAKVNAFISTIIEIAQNYNFSKESFYLASLRSFQEANNNYFDELEQKALSFARAYQIDITKPVSSKELEEILIEEYGYTINEKELNEHDELHNLRSVFVPKTKTLLLAKEMDDAQKAFIFGKEIGYNYLNYKERLYTFSWIKFENFEQVLNNFYASYFAGALLLNKQQLTDDLTELFGKSFFDRALFLELLHKYNASPETFFQRLTNILPNEFGLSNLFFLRFTHKKESSKFHLTKELHLSHQHAPHANETNEHYCRRWVSLKVLQEITQKDNDHVFDLQISHYPSDEQSYAVISSATKDPFKENYYRSISIGILIDRQSKRKINFLADPKIQVNNVSVTCESCHIKDCKERVAEPINIEKQQRNKTIEKVVLELTQKFSK